MDANYHRNMATDPSFTILDFKRVFAQTKDQLMKILRREPQTLEDAFEEASVYLRI